MTAKRRVGLAIGVSLLWALAGCSGASERAPSSPLVIGATCTSADGYQVLSSGACAGSDGGPVACDPPDGYVDLPFLPPGIGYCLAPGGLYPHGYFTMNCGADRDCPAGSRCDGTQCRAPCTLDSDCETPNVCPIQTGIRFCQCPACLTRM